MTIAQMTGFAYLNDVTIIVCVVSIHFCVRVCVCVRLSRPLSLSLSFPVRPDEAKIETVHLHIFRSPFSDE